MAPSKRSSAAIDEDIEEDEVIFTESASSGLRQHEVTTLLRSEECLLNGHRAKGRDSVALRSMEKADILHQSRTTNSRMPKKASLPSSSHIYRT